MTLELDKLTPDLEKMALAAAANRQAQLRRAEQLRRLVAERASVVVYDIEEGTNRTIVPHSAWPIRWNADDRFLILGTVGGEPSARPQITIVSVDPPGEERVLIDNAELIEVVPYPPTEQ